MGSDRNGDLPAMPVECDFSRTEDRVFGRQIDSHSAWVTGLTKRETFAAMAMQGLLAAGYTQSTFGDLQSDAVRHADALLAELSKTTSP
jgi:hypothetical protein